MGYDTAAQWKGGGGNLSIWRNVTEVGGPPGPNDLVTWAGSKENGHGPQERMG
jgi:hypothetical protein